MKSTLSLNGDWEFAYCPTSPESEKPQFPGERAYDILMPVPGYWDDHETRLRHAAFWSRDAVFNPHYKKITMPPGGGSPPDLSLPYLRGTGWYKKNFIANADWADRSIILHLGGVCLEARVWLNGILVGYHPRYYTPFQCRLDEALRPGESNELIIAVSNTREDRVGCSIRGYKGQTGGIHESVFLEIADSARILDAYVYPTQTLDALNWVLTLEHKSEPGDGLQIDWDIVDPRHGAVAGSGTVDAAGAEITWTTNTFGLEPWSDRSPRLYTLRFRLRRGNTVLDKHGQRFGLRALSADDKTIYLNGEATFLRGLTEHAYFPEICTVPNDETYYYERMKKLREIGFNWIRFHTWVPPVACRRVADELGMMLQVETPNGFDEADWVDTLRTCRRHPSVVLYCCGNEVAMNEPMLDQLEIMAAHRRQLAPETLFNPFEALRQIEYETEGPLNNALFRQDRYDRVKPISDVVAPHGMLFSYFAITADDQNMKERYNRFEKPCLIHEAGIHDTFLNLDLECRYKSTRIGTDLYRATREYLEEKGVLEHAPRYYQNSCRWMRQFLKYSIENLRRLPCAAGFDYLGATDHHWHRCGYPTGILNEFYEMKPGISREFLLKFNAGSVLLADVGTRRNLSHGDTLTVPAYASLFGGAASESGTLTWWLEDAEQRILAKARREVGNLPMGTVSPLGDLVLEVPALDVPAQVRLRTRLSLESCELENDWDYWIFPEPLPMPDNAREFRVCEKLSPEDVDFMTAGGRVLLLGASPFPSRKIGFQLMTAGRPQGLNATVAHDHPILREFPHEGFCDWQFRSMMGGGRTAIFDDLPLPFHPILEMVSGYKFVRKQAALFELRVGKGGLLVCSLNLKTPDPGAAYLQRLIERHLASDHFSPAGAVEGKAMASLFAKPKKHEIDFTDDFGYDAGGHVKQ